ncbi:aldehyde dehydrogenase family protein [Piscinibacter sp. HJYY11]|uniref:aldehyde dehydrogenase family protein n=1 Tax=Piscinibacter sp. HJYY11 TaxID=2801333 RepID=UPI00191CED00|nr:aldehyde dehydrogenase family protein [Piscinibacter sp. HJYY11]MBL0729617.1 aldehyde dehydrogenase family protein [Piscinibacter sp. HJYY11]
MTTQASQVDPNFKPFHGRLLINGDWCGAEKGGTIERRSPAHNYVVGVYAEATESDAERAVKAARVAFDSGPWPHMSGSERSRILRAVADGILSRKDELARLETLENGKPLAQSLAEIEGAADLWHYAATLARNLHGDSYNTLGADTLGVVLRDPIGVVSIITPWNFPFLIVSQKLPFALAAGCTTVVKPAEVTSGTTVLLGEILIAAGLPPGVVNILTGPGRVVGEVLVTHPDVDMLSFTGSTLVGKQAVAKSAQTLKKVSMELGGKNPQVIFDDCDWEAAVDAVVYGIFFNAGQCCNSGSRILVQDTIADKFAAAVVNKAKQVHLGDPLLPGTQVGAITTEKQFETILAYIEGAKRAGATIALGGARVSRAGYFIEPTVITNVTPNMAIASEEVFGPVLSVLTFKTVDDAVALANSTLYGLSAAVWSSNFSTCLTAARRIRAGTVWINTFLEGHAELPFGGYRESGLGRELGRFATEDYTESKTLQMHLGARTNWYLPKP